MATKSRGQKRPKVSKKKSPWAAKKRSVVEMLITPAIADRMLEWNLGNRDMSETRSRKYLLDIRNGNFLTCHQGICFDIQGHLIDGQKRLWAISKSGKSVSMFVGTGFPTKTREVIDENGKRSVRDIMVINGHEGITHLHPAVAMSMIRFGVSANAGIVINPSSVSRSLVVQYVEEHLEGIRFSTEAIGIHDPIKGVTQASVAAPIARAYYSGESKKRLKEFGKCLVEGVVTSHKDSSARSLLKFLMMCAGHSSKSQRWTLRKPPSKSDMYYKTQTALWHFLEGKPLSGLYAASEEIWEIPSDSKFGKLLGANQAAMNKAIAKIAS